MSACMFWHKWSKWSDPVESTVTNFIDKKSTIITQGRMCLRCNIAQRRTVTR